MDSKRMVDALLEVDPGFERLCKTLFGDIVEPADVWDFMYADGISKQAPVEKAMPEQTDLSTRGGRFIRTMRRQGPATAGGLIGGSAVTAAGFRARANAKKAKAFDEAALAKSWSAPRQVKKSNQMDVVWEGTFSKTDDEKRQAFGWASVVEVDGKPVIDRQGDWITPDEIEKAAYNYVMNNRRGGHQHRRDENDQPIHVSDLIESFVVTPEKIEKMGLPASTPVGWWVGFKVHDDEAWEKVKKGEVTGFSLHGKGKRRDIE